MDPPLDQEAQQKYTYQLRKQTVHYLSQLATQGYVNVVGRVFETHLYVQLQTQHKLNRIRIHEELKHP